MQNRLDYNLDICDYNTMVLYLLHPTYNASKVQLRVLKDNSVFNMTPQSASYQE